MDWGSYRTDRTDQTDRTDRTDWTDRTDRTDGQISVSLRSAGLPLWSLFVLGRVKKRARKTPN